MTVIIAPLFQFVFFYRLYEARAIILVIFSIYVTLYCMDNALFFDNPQIERTLAQHKNFCRDKIEQPYWERFIAINYFLLPLFEFLTIHIRWKLINLVGWHPIFLKLPHPHFTSNHIAVCRVTNVLYSLIQNTK